MGANNKYEAAMHGGEYTPTTDEIKHAWYRSETADNPFDQRDAIKTEFDRWLDKVRAEAKAEALDSLAQELVDVDMAGADEPIRAYDAAVWLRARANQYKEQS